MFVETDFGPVDAEGCSAVQEALHPSLGAAVGCPRGVLACTLTVDQPNAGRAVTDALVLFSEARRTAGVAVEANVVHFQGWAPDEAPNEGIPALISRAGLQDRFGITRQYAEQLMNRKGAPDPLPVEGATRGLVYLMNEAVPYVAAALRRS